MSDSRASRPTVLTAEDLPGYRPALLRYAMLQIREAAVAEDLVQNTLVAALQALGSFRGDSSPNTWLIGILKRQIIDHYRRMTREAPLPVSGTGDDPDGDADLLDRLFARDGHWANQPGLWADPEGSLHQEDFLAVLEACLKGLAGQSGRVFALREIMELEPDEICKDLGLSRSNYWVLMHRARLRLRQCVERGWTAERS
jgi:RNA polymerase sigma-70 factor (ECF subfamily)